MYCPGEEGAASSCDWWGTSAVGLVPNSASSLMIPAVLGIPFFFTGARATALTGPVTAPPPGPKLLDRVDEDEAEVGKGTCHATGAVVVEDEEEEEEED